jgi:hypothetical protein
MYMIVVMETDPTDFFVSTMLICQQQLVYIVYTYASHV